MLLIDSLEPWFGALGRLMVGFRSKARVELLLEEVSKWPDRFSRRLAWMAKPESLRDGGAGGKFPETGDAFGDGGELVFPPVELVEGRAFKLLSAGFLEGWNALNTRYLLGRFVAFSPKEVEVRLTYFAREVGCGVLVKTG